MFVLRFIVPHLQLTFSVSKLRFPPCYLNALQCLRPLRFLCHHSPSIFSRNSLVPPSCLFIQPPLALLKSSSINFQRQASLWRISLSSLTKTLPLLSKYLTDHIAQIRQIAKALLQRLKRRSLFLTVFRLIRLDADVHFWLGRMRDAVAAEFDVRAGRFVSPRFFRS